MKQTMDLFRDLNPVPLTCWASGYLMNRAASENFPNTPKLMN